MKEFDLEAAKNGAAVCTRDGHEARIICFDAKDKAYPIVALVTVLDDENVLLFSGSGRYSCFATQHPNDLMMKSVKKEGWINIYKNGSHGWTHTSRDSALKSALNINENKVVDTVKVEWEE